MMLATWLILLVTILYTFASGAYLLQGQIGSAIIFGAYALANIGFFIQTGAFK